MHAFGTDGSADIVYLTVQGEIKMHCADCSTPLEDHRLRLDQDQNIELLRLNYRRTLLCYY